MQLQIKISISSIIITVFLVMAGLSCNTDLSRNSEDITLPELTMEQRVADVRYFFDFIHESYPFVEAIVHEKGLSSFYDYEEEYVERAKYVRNNFEFMSLFIEMMQRIEQGTGHADVATPLIWTNDRELNDEIAKYGISLKSFYMQKEWWNLFNEIKSYWFSDLPVMYLKGNYVTTEDYWVQGGIIDKGATVLKINNVLVDKYVHSIQNRIWLRFDRSLKKPYHSDGTPFVMYGKRQKDPWAVQFRLSDGSTVDYELPITTDITKVPNRPIPESNVICRELTDVVGYMKVASFPGVSARRAEYKEIRDFITGSQGQNEKLILDLRRNSGGSPVYWEENLIRFFVKEPVSYTQYSAVKKKIYDKLEHPFLLSRDQMKSIYDSGIFRKVMLNELPWKNLPDYFNDTDWYFFKVSRIYEPLEGFHFQNQIFVLMDNDSFSATEDFLKTIKQLGLAKLVGASSCGGAAAFIEPWLFELPNSHIIFSLEIELAFNSDGTINEIYGTNPDYAMEPSTYPTAYPTGFSKEELLKDTWIQWVIMN